MADEVQWTELAEWVKQCDVGSPVSPEDPRYVSLEEGTGGPESFLRGEEDHVLRILDCVQIGTAGGLDTCQLFSGYIGTGKSSELRRLRGELQRQGYEVLLSSAQDYHDLFHPLEIQDLLVILAGAVGEETRRALGEKKAPKQSYFDRFLEFLKSEVRLESVTAKLGVVDLKLALVHGEPWWAEIRASLSQSLARLAEHAHGYIQECIQHIRRGRPHTKDVVFLFDSLERLRGPEDELRGTMESLVRLFSQYDRLLRLPNCHVVYTVPPYLEMLSQDLANRYDRPIHVLPAVKVTQRGPGLVPHPPGVNALVEVVGRRIPLDRVFGDRLDLLETLVVYSGGHLKTLLSFVRELLFRAKRRPLPPTTEDIERLLQPFRERARAAIRREGIRLLDAIRRTGSLDDVTEGEFALLARYMDTQLVLCYRNGEGWYEVHPLVRQHVEELAQSLPS